MQNVNMAGMAAMGGPVGGAPMPLMNNGAVPQPGPMRQLPVNDANRSILNTYIYEYFLRYNMFDCARSILQSSDGQIKVLKDSAGGRRDENGNLIGNGLDDSMDTDNKDDLDGKRPDDLPAPDLPTPLPDSCFLYEWFSLFWDMYNAQKGNGKGAQQVTQYVNHTQQAARQRQMEQQNMLRQMRPEMQQQYLMRNGMGNMNMMKNNNLQRQAMTNSQNNPQVMQMMQQQKTNQMQRDPSDMDGNRARPASPGSTDNAPSPSKRARLDGAGPFPNQAAMMQNGRPAGAMPGQQQVGSGPNSSQVQQLLISNGIDPGSLDPVQFNTLSRQSPAVQAKTIAVYAANLQQHHGNQMPNKQMPNGPGGPQGQGSPMVPQGPDAATLTNFYNPGEMAAGGMRQVNATPGQGAGGSNHALQDYQMQLMLLEQQNKKRLMMARQEQDMGAMPRADGQQGGPAGPGGAGAQAGGPNAQNFQGNSPGGGARSGASPNPTEQMKRNAQQMGNAGMSSPLPDSRGSPGASMNFMSNQMDPNQAPHFFKGNGMENGMMNAVQMNGMRPPGTHPGQPFNPQLNQQQMMSRQQQAAAAGQGGPQMQWQGGPNGQMPGAAGPQGQVQGTPQQRAAMPPPSAPAGGANNANARNTASPQAMTAAPPTPQQANKANPKKKDTKASKSKAAAQKKSNANLNAAAAAGATPAADAPPDAAEPPATPITPVNPAFAKGQPTGPVVPNGQPAAPAVPAAPVAPAIVPPANPDPNQVSFMPDGSMDQFAAVGDLAFTNPMGNEDMVDFDFDSFLNPNEGGDETYDLNMNSFEDLNGAIGAE